MVSFNVQLATITPTFSTLNLILTQYCRVVRDRYHTVVLAVEVKYWNKQGGQMSVRGTKNERLFPPLVAFGSECRKFRIGHLEPVCSNTLPLPRAHCCWHTGSEFRECSGSGAIMFYRKYSLSTPFFCYCLTKNCPPPKVPQKSAHAELQVLVVEEKLKK